MPSSSFIPPECFDTGVSPYRLRIASKNKQFTEYDEVHFSDIFEDSQGSMLVDGVVYIAFRHHKTMLDALEYCLRAGYHASRAVDPYAIHCSMTRRHTRTHLETHFSRYGPLVAIDVRESRAGRYAFVNFMHGYDALLALYDGERHFPGGVASRIRAKVLSATEPYAPKPYSPARYATASA